MLIFSRSDCALFTDSMQKSYSCNSLCMCEQYVSADQCYGMCWCFVPLITIECHRGQRLGPPFLRPFMTAEPSDLWPGAVPTDEVCHPNDRSRVTMG